MDENGNYHWPSQDPIEDAGTDSIYVWPIFEAYVREYPHKYIA